MPDFTARAPEPLKNVQPPNVPRGPYIGPKTPGIAWCRLKLKLTTAPTFGGSVMSFDGGTEFHTLGSVQAVGNYVKGIINICAHRYWSNACAQDRRISFHLEEWVYDPWTWENQPPELYPDEYLNSQFQIVLAHEINDPGTDYRVFIETYGGGSWGDCVQYRELYRQEIMNDQSVNAIVDNFFNWLLNTLNGYVPGNTFHIDFDVKLDFVKVARSHGGPAGG